jgi:hypothetical protein
LATSSYGAGSDSGVKNSTGTEVLFTGGGGGDPLVNADSGDVRDAPPHVSVAPAPSPAPVRFFSSLHLDLVLKFPLNQFHFCFPLIISSYLCSQSVKRNQFLVVSISILLASETRASVRATERSLACTGLT